MWASKRGNNANKFMPVFLSLQWLRSSPESKAGWLLCVLQLWFDWLPTTSNEYRLLFVDGVNWRNWTGKKQLLVANCFFNLPSPRWRNGWPTYYACTFCLVRLYHVPFLINVRQVNVQNSGPTMITILTAITAHLSPYVHRLQALFFILQTHCCNPLIF